MGKEVSFSRLRAEQTSRRAGIMIRLQSLLILFFLVWMAEDYDHNQYFQAWAKTHLGVIEFLLNGTLAAFYAGVLAFFYLRQPIAQRAREKIRKLAKSVMGQDADA